MKRFLIATLFAGLALLMAGTAHAQDFPAMDKSPMDCAYYPPRAAFRSFAKTEEEKKASMPVIRVLYSRPQKNNRQVMGNLVPTDGTVWRAGANESSEIKFYQDVMIGNTRVAAGTYTFYIKATEKEWTVVFNSDLDGWGAYAYNAANDVASVTVPVQEHKETIEAFSIVFEKADDGAHMVMGWDKTMVRVPVKF